MSREINLPSKPQLSIAEAAEELRCSEADVRYYLEEGLLRHAIDLRKNKSSAMIPASQMGDTQKQALHSLNKPSIESILFGSKELRVVDSAKVIPLPDYLYLPAKLNLFSLYEDNIEGKLWTFSFETFEGDSIFKVLKLSTNPVSHEIHGSYVGAIYQGDDGICSLEPAVVTREELDRFIQASKHKTPPPKIGTAPHQKVSTTNLAMPFSVPAKRSNPVAEAMVHYGNEFYRKENRVPPFVELMNYMVINDHGNYGVDEKLDGVYVIDGEEYEKTLLNSRYRRYKQFA
jgi:hypothetical protein